MIEKRVAKTDPEFRAVIASLGAMGILTRLQLRLVDQLYFETIQKIVHLKDTLMFLFHRTGTITFNKFCVEVVTGRSQVPEIV